MTERNESRPVEIAGDRIAEEGVRRLIEAAGPRPPVPPGAAARLRASARGDWVRLVERRVPIWRRPLPRAVAAAAAATIAALGVWWWRSAGAPTTAAAVATVERVAGPVRVAGEPLGGSGGGAATLAAGSEIVTGRGGRLAVRMASGPSLRIDSESRVRLTGRGAVELRDGAVYVDSGVEPGHGTVDVATEIADVREIGTRFEVRYDPGAERPLRVRVRDGSVAIRSEGGSFTAAAGEQLMLAAGGEPERRAAPAHGREWAWVAAAAPSLAIEGVRLGTYLDWVSRELGRPVVFAEPALAEEAAEIVLHGSIDGLGPRESLAAVLPGSRLAYRLDADGTLAIERAR